MQAGWKPGAGEEECRCSLRTLEKSFRQDWRPLQEPQILLGSTQPYNETANDGYVFGVFHPMPPCAKLFACDILSILQVRKLRFRRGQRHVPTAAV